MNLLARRTGRAPAILMVAYTNYETDPRVIRAAEAAVEAGFEVDVIALRRQGQPAIDTVRGVHVARVGQERYRGHRRLGYLSAYLEFFLRCMFLSTWMFARKGYRVIHVHNMPDVLVFAALIPRLLGAKVVLDIHDPMPETFGAKYSTSRGKAAYVLLLWLEKLSVAFASRTITVNEPVRDGVLVRHGYRKESIGVVSNFADDRLFAPVSPKPVGERLRLVFHGTILERYGLRTLVEAVSKVRNRARLEVRIIGDGDYSTTLRDAIHSRGIDDVISFDNRFYPLHQIPRLLADCHVGVVPLDVTPISDFALPLKLVEYTCLGLPSITVPSTAIRFYFRPDECMFYPPGDSTALARLIDEVIEDPRSLEAYRERLPFARTRLSWSREKAKYVAMLRELAGIAAPLTGEDPTTARLPNVRKSNDLHFRYGPMNTFFRRVLHGDATIDQARDTGMALVLLLLLVAWFTRTWSYAAVALVVHVVNMTAPQIYRPIAVVWFALSHLLGTIVSRIILVLVFLLVVTPVGLMRRIVGSDSLKLRAFKAGHTSVMKVRNHTFTGRDLEHPY